MKKISSTIALWFCLLGGLFTLSCTDLDEKVFSSLDVNNFFRTESEVMQNVGRIYRHLRAYNFYFGATALDLATTDETIIPLREGNLWWDNGEWIQFHRHEFHPNHRAVGWGWEFCFNGVTMCNQVLSQLEETTVPIETKPNIIAEVKTMRAFFFLKAMDWFGDIPVTTDFKDTALPVQRTRSEVFDFLVSELTAQLPLLDETPTRKNYGRATRGLANMMLTKLYLNAEVWKGTPMWDKAIEHADQVINGPYSLSENFFSNFSVQNENSPENIFVIPYDRTYVTNDILRIYSWTLNSLSRFTFNFSAGAWSGFAALEEFYNLFHPDDIRIETWLVGPQFSSSGEPLMITPSRQLNYTPGVRALNNPENPALVDEGPRFKKYEYEPGLLNNQSMSNDFVLYRLADAILMKAEALMRKNGNMATEEAVALVNQVHTRSFKTHSYTVETLTMDELLAERGREFAWEGHRRTDLIRFGKWLTPWYEKPQSPERALLFPVPYFALDLNPHLKQNTGY